MTAAPALNEALGGPALWIKRDDLIPFGLGGNKIRGLELILADAIEQGADPDTAVTLAALRQAGVRVVEDGQILLDLAAALDRQPPLKGRRIAVITNSGGTGVEVADLMEARGLRVPRLSEALQSAICPALPAYGSAANPIDVTTEWRRFPEMYGESLKSLLDSDEVDAVVPALLQRSALMAEVTDRVIAEAQAPCDRGSKKPIHVCWVAPKRRRRTAGDCSPRAFPATTGRRAPPGFSRCRRLRAAPARPSLSIAASPGRPL